MKLGKILAQIAAKEVIGSTLGGETAPQGGTPSRKKKLVVLLGGIAAVATAGVQLLS